MQVKLSSHKENRPPKVTGSRSTANGSRSTAKGSRSTAKGFPPGAKGFRSPAMQAGLVMILVLLIIALMITLLGFMVEKQHLLVRRITNQNVAEQGFQYAQGVNAWAEVVLDDDVDRETDYWDEDWAKFGEPPEENVDADGREDFSVTLTSRRDEEEQEELAIIDFGFDGLEYSIEDLQGRFNLNNLSNPDTVLLGQQRRIFLNLLELLQIGDADSRLDLVGALVDWLDEDGNPDSNGFESNDYQALDTPYHAADQQLTSLGELKFLRGFDDEIISTISPFVTVLPVDNARININTTSPEVLASLSSTPVSDIGPVTAFLAARIDEDFLGFRTANVAEAENAVIAVSVVRQPPIRNMLQTNSQFFQIRAKVTLGEAVYCMKTLVLRESATQGSTSSQKVSVLRREYDTICDNIRPNRETAVTASEQSDSAAESTTGAEAQESEDL